MDAEPPADVVVGASVQRRRLDWTAVAFVQIDGLDRSLTPVEA